MKQIHFNYIGVAGSSGQKNTVIYDFEYLTVNGKQKEFKEDLKDFMLGQVFG